MRKGGVVSRISLELELRRQRTLGGGERLAVLIRARKFWEGGEGQL